MKSTQSSESPKSLPRFDAPIGPTVRTKSSKSPLAVLQLFLTAAILKSIVLQTNTFAESKGVRLDLHVEKLQAFLGMNIAMGLLRLPQVRDYWGTGSILSVPWFPSIMPRDSFFQILRYLHLVHTSTQKKKGEEGYDPLFKVRPLFDHLSGVFPRYYQPFRCLSIDETTKRLTRKTSYSMSNLCVGL